jgi:hypothetical protein
MTGPSLWLVIALSLAHSSSLSAGQDGPDSSADTSNVPATVEGGKAKGLRLPSTDLERTTINCKKGAQDRGTNALRTVTGSAGHLDTTQAVHVVLWHDPENSVFRNDKLVGPLNEATLFLRGFADDFNVSFEPSAAMTFQHATKVVDGAPHSRGTVWYGADGHVQLWRAKKNSGEVIYNLQGNVGVGTPFNPNMGLNVGNPVASNNILISKDLGLYMLYWQQTMHDGAVRVRVGKFEEQTFFDRNAIAYDPIGGFLAQNFNQSASIPFPEYGFGGAVSFDVNADITARVSVQNSMSSGNTVGFDGMTADTLFKIIEVDQRVWVPMGNVEREGHRRFILWHSGIDDWQSGSGYVNGWGAAFNMDQAIADDTVMFCRVGWGQRAVTPMQWALSAGVAAQSVLPHVDMGVAVGWGQVTTLGRQALADPTTPAGNQLLVEWYANMHISPSLHMGPVIQAVRDPAAGVSTSIVYGWRASWAY